MAQKFILVPENLYNGLLSTKNEDLNLNFARENLENIKLKKGLNKNEKNIQFNQELHRFLKLKKQNDNKPIKVELSNGLKAITKPEEIQAQVLLPETENEDTGFLDKNYIDDEIYKPSDFSTPLHTTHIQRPFFEKIPTLNLELSPVKTKRIKIDKSNKNGPEILNYIRNHPKIFDVNKKDEIINKKTGLAFKGSNLVESIERILNPDPSINYTPPGTNHLRKKIFINETTKKLAKNISNMKGGSFFKFKPQKW